MAKNNTNNSIKILTKLFDSGYCTEKEILGITLEKMLVIPNVTVTEIATINELQKAIKANKVISFLGGVENGKDE
jgi:hypothetical protein